MSDRMGRWSATALLVVSLLSATTLAIPDWSLGRQSFGFPWVAGMPPGTIALFAITSILVLLGATYIVRSAFPGLLEGMRSILTTAAFTSAALVGAWDGMYATVIDDTAIPIVTPIAAAIATAVGVAMAATAGINRSGQVAVALLVVAPILSMETLGWCIHFSSPTGLLWVALLSLPGILVGLVMILIPWKPTTTQGKLTCRFDQVSNG